ncbi:MAG: hypothetical protein H6617_09720 [Bdellovibrionaceae bacterium]|nr:hypothetical protein [Bdellovibrionales bacterium]MCB9254947.1 hypothetical protein [Pseudobdellovibrionaceae bacterium]
MNQEFYKHRLDKQLGPLVAEYNHQTEALTLLKNDLRTSENIDAIIALSEKQLRIENHIWDQLGGRPIPPTPPTVWERLAILALKATTAVLLVRLAIMLF